MHEHLGNGRPAQARGGGGPLPVDNPTQDPAWMAEELTLARKNGNLACIVAAGLNIPSADNAAYLTKLSQASGVRIVAAAAYYKPQSYPAGTDKLTEDEIADLIVKGARDLRSRRLWRARLRERRSGSAADREEGLSRVRQGAGAQQSADLHAHQLLDRPQRLDGHGPPPARYPGVGRRQAGRASPSATSAATTTRWWTSPSVSPAGVHSWRSIA